VPDIIQIQLLAVLKCASDSSPYVRRCAATAIPKIYALDATQLPSLTQVHQTIHHKYYHSGPDHATLA
jgi:AP-3 complex subunit beta